MRVVAVVQARMESTRLPGKVLMPLNGETLLGLLLKRLALCRELAEVVVATTVNRADDAVAEHCATLGVRVYRGSVDDVLARYCGAAAMSGAEVVVRITADSPFLDPAVCDRAVRAFLDRGSAIDYLTNSMPLSYPDGLGVEVMHASVLERCCAEARAPFEREHVTQYIRRNPGMFRIEGIVNERDLSGLRWTVDEPEDYRFAREVFARLYPLKGIGFTMADILQVLEAEPALSAINSHVGRDEGLARSIKRAEQP